jgi:NADPH:quinone reductase-like Zn-dependent oxidoreductase
VKGIVQERYGDTDVLELCDLPVPEAADGEVVIEVYAAGLDPGVWHLMTGRPYLVRLIGFGLRKQVRGMDVAGLVEAVGRDVSSFRVGDEVFGTCHGSFAELATARQGTIAPKPANLTFQEAAAVPVSGCTALQGLRDAARLRSGQKVLITGAAGGVGTFAVQIAKAFGADVTGVCSTTGTALVRSIGADQIIDYTREDFTDGRRRYDVILDTAGRRPLSQLRRALVPGGTLVVVGGEGGGRWLGGFDRGFRGQVIAPFTGQRVRQLSAKVTQGDLLVLTELIEAGKLRPVVERTYPLSDVASAIRHWQAGHARGKTVIAVASTPSAPPGSGAS